MTFHMRAVVVREYGGRAEIVELPAPEVEPGHILIKIAAAGMNPMDRSIAGGAWKSVMAATFPMILGFDVAGSLETSVRERPALVSASQLLGSCSFRRLAPLERTPSMSPSASKRL